jgi:hypothetical protein
MGRFEPGNTAAANRGPNKVSSKVKESIVQFMEDNVDSIQESFDTLKPRERLQFIADLLPYVSPKLQATSLDITGDLTIITFKDAE